MSTFLGEKSWQVPNQLGPATAVAREAMDWVEPFPLSEQTKYSIRLAIEEMLANTIKYGYEDKSTHLISIRLNVSSDLIQLDMVDDARPFDPTLQPEPDVLHNIDDGVEGGLGIELVRCICRQMDYRREGNQNHITLHIGVLDPDDADPNPIPPEQKKDDP